MIPNSRQALASVDIQHSVFIAERDRHMRFIQHPEQIIQTSVLADLTGKRIFLQIGVRNVVAEVIPAGNDPQSLRQRGVFENELPVHPGRVDFGIDACQRPVRPE